MDDAAQQKKQYIEALGKTLPEEVLSAEGMRHQNEQSVTIDDSQLLAQSKQNLAEIGGVASLTGGVTEPKKINSGLITESSSDLLLDTPHLSSKAPSILPNELDQSQRYQLQTLLGKGGMGKVYSFRDLNLQRDVAVKSMKNHDTTNQRVIAAFVKEARITASLEHSGVLPVHDLDFTDSGEVYYTMRQVQGISLGEAIEQSVEAAKNGVAPVEAIANINDRINIMIKVCDTLELAHQRGILHRDIKPDNIMLGKYGEVYVVDWGTALMLDEEGASKGNRVGTPLYMSPEQSRREAPLVQNEVYSIGATLFQLLFMRYPIFSANLEEFWERKKNGQLDAITKQERALIPSNLLAIVLKTLSSDIEERYQSAADLAKDLRLFQSGMAVSAFTDTAFAFCMRWYRRNKKAILVAMIVALPMLFVVAWGVTLVQNMNAERLRHWDLEFEDNFNRSSVGENWTMDAGRADIIDNQLVISGASSVYARLMIPHKPVVRLEYEAMVPTGFNACDMSAYMFTTPGKFDSYNEPLGYLFGFGIGNNASSVLRRSGNMMASTDKVLITPGKWHHVVCEKDVSAVTLSVDGQVVLSVNDHFPPRFDEVMYAVLYTYKSTLHIRSVKLFSKTVAERARTVDIADEFFWSGQHAAAARLYGTVWKDHRYTELGGSALFGLSLCLAEQGQTTAAIEHLLILASEKGAESLQLSAKLKMAELYMLDGQLVKGIECAKSASKGVAAIETMPEMVTFFDLGLNALRKANYEDKAEFIRIFDDYCEWWYETYPAHMTISSGRFWVFWSDEHRSKLGDWKGYCDILARGRAVLSSAARRENFDSYIFAGEWRGIWNEERLAVCKASGYVSLYMEELFAAQKFDELNVLIKQVQTGAEYSVAEKFLAKKIYTDYLESQGLYNLLVRHWGDDAKTDSGIDSLVQCLLGEGRAQEVLDLLKPRWDEIESNMSEGNPVGTVRWRSLFYAYRMLNDAAAVQRIVSVITELAQHPEIKYQTQWTTTCLVSVERAEQTKKMVETTWSDRSQHSAYLVLAESYWMRGDLKQAQEYYHLTMKPPFSNWDVIAARRLKALEAVLDQ